MNKNEIYDRLAERKISPKDFSGYIGDNGRVNRCVNLFQKGILRIGGSLLDVGGGTGDLCYAVKKLLLFDRVYALDISKKNLNAALSKGCEIINSDVDTYGLVVANESIDVVTALDFIEHILDPVYFAKECHRVLKKDGEVFINTPNIQFWRNIEQLLFGVNFPHTSGDHEVYHGGHLAFFTYNDLCDIFRSVGFHGFVQLKDEENYEQPLMKYIKMFNFSSQDDYVKRCMYMGNPNLLFRCIKS